MKIYIYCFLGFLITISLLSECSKSSIVDPSNKASSELKTTLNITVNFSSLINSACSPMLFGASNEPNRPHQTNVYPKIGASGCGMKFQRGTLHMERLFTKSFGSITLADYQSNKNGCATPSNWDWSVCSWAVNAKAQGMKTMCNMFYCPAWLTYNNSMNGVPKNWSVYQDIIKKIIQYYGSNFDYFEILNESTCGGFLSTSGSGYASKTAAAKDIYYYAASAVRAVNSTIQVGGDGSCQQGGDFGSLGTILRDPRNTTSMIQFVSWHRYDPNPPGTDKASEMTTLLNNSGRPGLPCFVNEYNSNYNSGTTDARVVGNQTVSYMGTTLLGFMTQTQIKGAAIYALLPNNDVLDEQEDCEGCTNIAQGLYSWNGSSAKLRTTTRAFTLLSKSLKLGAGNFRSYGSSGGSIGYTLGLSNSAGNVCAALVNTSGSAQTVNLTFSITGCSGTHTYQIYTADAGSNTGESVTTTGSVTFTSSGTSISGINCPVYSIVGILIL